MKPLSRNLRERLQRASTECRLYVEALKRYAEDVRLRKSQFSALTLSNVEVFDDGAVRLTAGSASKISHAAGTTYLTDLDSSSPVDVIAYELDDAIGAEPRLSKVSLYLTRKRDGGQPAYDGAFVVTVYRLARRIIVGNYETWSLAQVAEPVRVTAASMGADAQLVDFNFTDLTTGPLYITEDFRPIQVSVKSGVNDFRGRFLVAVVTTKLGTNTNYGLATDTGQTATKTVALAGTLRHRRLVSAPLKVGGQVGFGPGLWSVTAPTVDAMIRCDFYLGTYPTSGTISAETTNKLDLGGSVAGTVEFVVQKQEPSGTSILVEARVASPDSWVTVVDGQSPADVGLSVSQTYEIRATLSANAGQDVTPTLRALGIIDRVTTDLSEIASLDGFSEQADPVTGEVKMAEGEVALIKHGDPDFFDQATDLFATYYFSELEFRAFVGHPDLGRDEWLHLDTWRVDDYSPGETEITARVVSVLERLRGKYPRATGNLVAFVLKAATSDLTGGTHLDDFNREISQGIETAGTVVVSVAASATEYSRGVSPLGVPNIAQWPTGPWSVDVSVNVANSNLYLAVAIARVNASGTEQEISPYTAEQALSAATTYAFSWPTLAWAAGAATDRLKVVYRFRNNVASTQQVTLDTGTVATEIVPPWVPVIEEGSVYYNLDTLQAAYLDWRDNQVGLLERYRGEVPANTTDLVRKEVRGADGKRELERLAFLNGGTVIASQGRVKYVNLVRPTSTAVAFFPLEENTVIAVDPGLRARIPEFRVPFGYGVETDSFRGQIKFVQADALTRFGPSRIDNPPGQLEEETARWIADEGLAARVGEPIVQSLAAGMNVWTIRPNIPHPELEIGDLVAVETTQFVGRHPASGDALRGVIWGVGVIIGTRGLLHGREFRVWVRDYDSLFAVGMSAERLANRDLPIVEATVLSLPDEPANAVVRLRAYPPSAAIYYYVHDDNTNPPDHDFWGWTLYADPVTVQRDQSVDILFSFFAVIDGAAWRTQTVRVPPDKTPTITTLTLTQETAPSSVVRADAAVDADVRRVRWYRRADGNWPTTGGGSSSTAPLDQTYHTKEAHILADGGGAYKDGTPADGGLIEYGETTQGGAVPTYASSALVRMIAVPLDNDGNPGPRKTAELTVTGGTPPLITAITWAMTAAGTSCGSPRLYTIAWTPNGSVSDGTHDLVVYITVNGDEVEAFTEASPASTTSKTNVDGLSYASGGKFDPSVTVKFRYELKAGSTVVDAGQVLRSGGGDFRDTFTGMLCVF